MRILGIDPGLANVGYGIIDHVSGRSTLVALGSIYTSPVDPLAARLRQIHDGIRDIIAAHAPEAASVEQLFFCTNVKTAISVAQGRGVCILATATAGLPLHEYTPLQIKLAVTGSGKAGKLQVLKMVRALLALQQNPDSNHSADALAAALCHAHSLKFAQLSKTILALKKTRPRGRSRFRVG